MKKLTLFFACAFFLAALTLPCLGFAGSPPEPGLMLNLPKDKDLPVMIPIRDIKSVTELEGRMVLLKGTFAGWEDIGEPAPFSRRDWVIKDESGAIFVHGQYPAGLDPLDPRSIGKPVQITGRVIAKLVSQFGNVHKVVFIDRR